MTEFWDDFEEDAKDLSGPVKGPTCGIKLLLDSLDDYGRDVVERAIARQDLTNPALVKAIRKRVDTTLSNWTMGNHRRGNCACKNG